MTVVKRAKKRMIELEQLIHDLKATLPSAQD